MVALAARAALGGPFARAAPLPVADSSSPASTPATTSRATPMWPDDRFHRVAALALIGELRSALLSESSATLTLERWCRRHGIADDARIVAEPIPVVDAVTGASLPSADRVLLSLGAFDTVRHRHVSLSCGSIVLSDADNWYVPERLDPEMNRTLDSTRIPFGKVIASLGFTRTTLNSQLLWSPLPADWSDAAPATQPGPIATGRLQIPATLFENRALLHDRAGRPLALLVERYRAGVLQFAPPPP